MKAKGNSGLPARSVAGFTVIELLVAIALGLVVLAGLFRVFKVQQDSYLIQDQVSGLQQNLRAAMYVIIRDLQMAGYYTNFDGNSTAMDWNADGSDESGRPLVFARNDITAEGDNIRDGTDEIVIVKASREDGRPLTESETASLNTINIDWNLDGQPGDDLNTTGRMYGVLIKNDLSRAELFRLGSGGSLVRALNETYSANADDESLSDRVHRADIIIYRVDDSTPARPRLVRRNLGSDSGFQEVAQDIENLQFRYLLNDNTWVSDPGASQVNVRAVEVFLIGRTASPQRGIVDTSTYTFGSGETAYSYTPPADDRPYRRKVLTALVKTRNIGL